MRTKGHGKEVFRRELESGSYNRVALTDSFGYGGENHVEPITKVVFRVFPEGDVVALFPEEPWSGPNDISSYMHVGQHGPASTKLIKELRRATKKEYSELAKELRAIGYKLSIKEGNE